MRKLKILFGASFLIVLLLLFTSSAAKFMSEPKSVKPMLKEELAIAKLDPKEIEEYSYNKQQLTKALKNYFDKAIASGDIVGAGVSIVKGDSIVISQGFGKRDIHSIQGVNGETVFRLGSISKGFAGVLSANFKSEGQLDWQDKVSDFVPGFKLGDKNNTDKITLANILSHTAGTPYHSFTDLIEAGLPLTDIAKRFSTVKPISKPGSAYSYQNAMFALSSEIMRKATGVEMTTSLNKKFFKPLGMCNTSMDRETLVHSTNIAMPHVKSKYGFRTIRLNNNYFNAVAAGGISSSAKDMGKWMRFLLGHNPEIMNSSALHEVFNPYIEIRGGSKYYQHWPGHVSSYYGFGWRIHKFLEDKEEKVVWHHGGSVNDYRNEIALYPEADLGICVLLNSNSKLAKTVIPDLYKIVNDIYSQPSHTMVMNN